MKRKIPQTGIPQFIIQGYNVRAAKDTTMAPKVGSPP
jgi:hypothetical protein